MLHFMECDKSNNHHMAINIDMSKAYDRVEWAMIISIMEKVGFNEK